MQNDVRLLTLYKQHYMDQYPQKLVSQYSSWGYYDGIDIKDLNKISYPSLTEDTSALPIEKLWYGAGETILSLNGGYSNQTISIFRCVDDDPDHSVDNFWQYEHTLPYFAIGFVQLINNISFVSTAKAIEKISNIGEDPGTKAISRGLAYGTFDNTDLVILLRGNSIHNLICSLTKIENLPDVRYVHSVLSVSEEYLEACKNRPDNFEFWHGTKCFTDELISRMTIQFVLSAKETTLKHLKGVLDRYGSMIKGYHHATYSYVPGHESVQIDIPDTDVKSALTLILPGGFATHQNELYGEGIYNISTSFCVSENAWGTLDAIAFSKNNSGIRSWCRSMINDCKDYAQAALQKKDESLYSYCQAMTQTLNTLDQYEQFEMSRDVFYLVLPAFQMFKEQLSGALEKAETDYLDNIDNIKEALRFFLTSVNSIMYHTIHTDQVFLMKPGYSGSSYSIPLKLSLIYLWFIDRLTEALNDGSEKYSCILAPDMESRPATRIVNLLEGERSRLIYVQLSQRSLYFPRYLLIILTHEIAHYVGKKIRNRQKRCNYIILTLAHYISELLLPYNYKPFALRKDKKDLAKLFISQFKANIEYDSSRYLKEKVTEACEDPEFYADELTNELTVFVYEYVITLDISEHVNELDIVREQDIYSDEAFDNFQIFGEIQDTINKRKQDALTSGQLEEIVDSLIKLYREVFSDLAANSILQCTYDKIQRAFQISEGISVTEADQPSQQAVREMIMRQILRNESPEIAVYKVENVYENRYGYQWMWYYLYKYAKKCQQDIDSRCASENVMEIIAEIRELFSMLWEPYNTGYSEFYQKINERIQEYFSRIEEKYNV